MRHFQVPQVPIPINARFPSNSRESFLGRNLRNPKCDEEIQNCEAQGEYRKRWRQCCRFVIPVSALEGSVIVTCREISATGKTLIGHRSIQPAGGLEPGWTVGNERCFGLLKRGIEIGLDRDHS